MHTNCLTSLGLQDTKSTAAEFKQLFTIHLITKSKDNSPSLSNLTNKKPKLILKIKLILNFTEVTQQTVCPPLEWHPCGKLQQSVSSQKSACFCHCVTLVLKRLQISSDPNLSVTTPNSQNNTKKHVHSSIRPATPVFCRVKIIDFFKGMWWIWREQYKGFSYLSYSTIWKKGPLLTDPFHHVSCKNRHFS